MSYQRRRVGELGGLDEGKGRAVVLSEKRCGVVVCMYAFFVLGRQAEYSYSWQETNSLYHTISYEYICRMNWIQVPHT